MRRAALAVVAAGVVACAPAVATNPARPADPVARLRFAIDSLMYAAPVANAWLGVLAVNSRTGETLYAHNPDKSLMPASNMKIVTGAVALAQLGPDYRFRTIFAARRAAGAACAASPVCDSELKADLVVIGRGDPTVSDRMRGDAFTVMQAIADSLRVRGIQRITGGILRAGNAFPDTTLGYGWEWDDLRTSSGAGVDELLWNEGMLRQVVKVNGTDSLVIRVAPHPGMAYLDALRSALEQRGIGTAGAVSDTMLAADVRLDTLFTLLSPPLREILPHFEKPSQNQIGEILLRTLGLERTGVGTADSGAAVVRRQLVAWGAAPEAFIIYDGSGLSRHNLLTPRTLVQTLSAMQRDSNFRIFHDALTVAGVDGTLRNRMRDTRAAGNLHGKTGSLEFVRALSGYVRNVDGDTVVFSILVNHFTSAAAPVTQLMDSIAVRLAGFSARQ